MAYYTKYNNKNYNLNLNAVDSTKYPTADTSGRPCKTSAYSTGISQDSGFRTGTTAIYTQLARAIKVVKNSNISSISVTYTDIDGTSQTKTAAGTYYAKPGTTYSWSVTAADNYDISGTRSGSSSGSGTLSEDKVYEVSPTAVKYYKFTLTNSGGTACSTSISASPSLASGGHIHEGETITVTNTLNSAGYGTKKATISSSGHSTFSSAITTYQTTNSNRDGWTTTTNASTATPLAAVIKGTIKVGTANVTCTTNAADTSYQYHGFTTVVSSKIGKNSSTTINPFGSTGVSELDYYPTNYIRINGDIHMDSDAYNYDGTTLAGMNFWCSIKHAALSRSHNLYNNSSATTAPTSIQIKLDTSGGGGVYKSYVQVWGVQVPE